MGKSFEEEMWSLHFDPHHQEKLHEKPLTFAQLGSVIALILLLFTGLFFGLTYDVWKGWWNRTSFDSAKWKVGSLAKSKEPIRSYMIDDLLMKHKLEGMTRDEIITLLGEPDDYPSFGGWDLQYYLGPERGLISLDLEWLVIRLDKQNKVSAYKVVSS